MLIDTHAHLTFPDFADDLDGILARAAEAGVTRVVTIGTSVESSRRAVALAEKYANVFAVVGVHPNSAHEATGNFAAELRELARSPRVVAIGEIGLDYHRLPPPERIPSLELEVLGGQGEILEALRVGSIRAAQARVFTQQLELASEIGLNVVIHERDSWDDAIAILAPFAGRVRAQFHCFGKSLAHAETVLAHGHLVSFTGIVTFKNATVVQETAARLPAGTFMVETDCPYLAPVPFRGKRCEPAHTRATAEHIAQLRAQPLADLAAETTATAEAFFRFCRSQPVEKPI